MYWKHHHGQRPDREARRGQRWGYRRPKHNIPVNIIERDTEFELHLHALTYDKENIKVSVVGDTLYISGKRTPADEHPNFLLQEYPIKSFERSFELSERADKANIKAHHKDGVLIVIVPKVGTVDAPEVEVNIE